jgi:hypothetical protein
VPDRTELPRLRLRVERALLVQRQVRSLLMAAEATLAGRRRDLRNHKARVARAAAVIPRSTSKERHS